MARMMRTWAKQRHRTADNSCRICSSLAFGFRSSKALLSERMDQLDCDMRADAEKCATWHAEHGMKVHGLEIHQSTTKEALKEIQDLAHKTSRSVERLLQAIVSNG